MIELLKYLANNLEPEQLLEVAHIVSKNPDMIDSGNIYIEMINAVERFEIREISKDQYEELKEEFKKSDERVNEIHARSEIYKLLKDNNISFKLNGSERNIKR